MKSLANILSALALLGSVALIVSGSWAAHHWPASQDRHLFEYMGQCILAGRTLYVDCWDNKPPLLPWVNAAVLALTNDSTVAITVAAGMAAAACVACVAVGVWICFGPHVAGATALLAAFVISLRRNEGCTNGTELYATLFESLTALCLFLAWRATKRRLMAWGLVGGMALALAFTAKQHALGGLIALGVVTLIETIRRRGFRHPLLRILLAACTGFVAVIGCVCAVLRAQGSLGEAVFAVFTSNLVFVRNGHSWFVPVDYQASKLTSQLEPLWPIIWLAGIGLLASIVRWRRPDPDEQIRPQHLPNDLVLLLTVWLGFGAWTVTWGPAHIPRYWHATYVPLFWLSAQTFSFLRPMLTIRPLHVRGLTMVVTLTAGWLMFRPALEIYQFDMKRSIYYAYEDPDRDCLQVIAAEVVRRTAPTDEIYMWGFEPGVYRFSHRFSPSRFFELGKLHALGANAEFLVHEVVETLRARPPRLVLIRRTDYSEVQSGSLAGLDIRGFADLLAREYDPAGLVRDMIFFERRPPGSDTAAPARHIATPSKPFETASPSSMAAPVHR